MPTISSEGEHDAPSPSVSRTSHSNSNYTLQTHMIQQRSRRFTEPLQRRCDATTIDYSTQCPLERCRLPLPGYAWGGTDSENDEAAPPSYPNSSPATPTPGTSRTKAVTQLIVTEQDLTNPPPTYSDCTIPPPTYDDLYEAPERSPKSSNIRSLLQDTRRLVPYLCALCLGMFLLAIGVKHTVLKKCERRFLEIWCIATSGLIFVCVAIAALESLRNFLKKIENIAPPLIYTGTVFCVSWFVGGLICSWDQLRDGKCDQEVPRTAFTACVISFLFLIIVCCCGKDVFHQNRTGPDR